MKEELEIIEQQLADLRLKQARLELENFKNHLVPTLEASIGKTFAYRNNSSGSDEPKWDVFRKLLGVEFSQYNAWLIFEECAVRGNGQAELSNQCSLVSQRDDFPRLEPGWTPCDAEEYERNRALTLATLCNPTRYRESFSAR